MRQMNFSIPILLYHQITPDVHPDFFTYSITPKTFNIHMKILKLLRFNSINLDQLEEYRKGNTTLPRKPILITFDDGFQESVDYAVPILKTNNFTAVFFIPTKYIGEGSHWLVPELGIEFPIIDWKTIKLLDSCGFQIGSHTLTHPHLSKISSDDCYKELEESRKTLEAYLGHEISHLAYPYGDFDEGVKSIAAEAGYSSACSCIEGLMGSEHDSLVLPRVYIKGHDTISDFIIKLHTGRKWETPRRFWLYTNGKLRAIERMYKKMANRLTI